jgi:hypothetical protein
MKTLDIQNHLQYELLYEAAVGRPRGYNIQDARIIGKVLDKFEAVGKVSEVTKTGVTLFTASSVPCKIELEDAEYRLLVEVFKEMVWTGAGVRKAVQVEDWLNG